MGERCNVTGLAVTVTVADSVCLQGYLSDLEGSEGAGCSDRSVRGAREAHVPSGGSYSR